jgi:voltage-gated potassium channel
MATRRKRKPAYNEGEKLSPFREQLNEIIFGAETPLGKAFDVILIVCIVLSVIAVMLDSVHQISIDYAKALYVAEWTFTILFTIEYLVRLYCVRKPLVYAKSFFGLVDLLSVLPTYISLILPGAKYMLVIRVLRVLRLFRVLKLAEYMDEANTLMEALANSRRKILVFLYTVSTLVVVFGSIMYIIEGEANGFTSIPKSIYWAIVTMTTVGYGDVSPQTPFGQSIASLIMILGYGIIAVPTGIYSAELAKAYTKSPVRNDACTHCGQTGHDYNAGFCKHCGYELPD